MELPIGYVGFTAPFEIVFFSDIGGRSQPFYDPRTESAIAALNGQLYGFEYVLAHHNEKAGQRQPFPQDHTVIQYRRLEGLIEESGNIEEYGWDDFEEFRLYGDETVDIHGWYQGVSGTTGYARVQINAVWMAAVLPRMTAWGANHAEWLGVLLPDEVQRFQASRSLIVELFYEMNINVQGAPIHQMTWRAYTKDPANGDQITWDSGNYPYVSNSPVEPHDVDVRCKAAHFQRPRITTFDRKRLEVAGHQVYLRFGSRARGLLGTEWVLTLRGAKLAGEISFKCGRPVLAWDKGHVRIGGFEVIFAESDRILCDKGRLVIPLSKQGFKVAVSSRCDENGKYSFDEAAIKVLDNFYFA